MASTFSPSLRIELIGNGDQSGVWGQTTNSNLGTIIEQAITGVESITMVNTDYFLSNFNGVADEARNAVLIVGGTNSAVRKVVAPLTNKTYTVKNETVGGFAINIGGSTGAVVSIPNGVTAQVYCDGINFYDGLSGVSGSFTVANNATVGGVLNGTTAVFSGAISSVSPAFTGTPTAPTAAPGLSNTQIATTAFVTAALQAVYPVGSIYTNATSASNPSTLLGFGTWTAFGAGRVMVGLDASDPLFDTAEETGGSKDAVVVSHTHTATVTDPGHIHPANFVRNVVSGGFSSTGGTNLTNIANTDSAVTGISVANSTTGVSGTNANVQPYITVYMWKRTA